MLAAGLAAFTSTPSAALSKSWATDADFAGGTFSGTEVAGSGAAASIHLSTDVSYNWVRMFPASAPSPRRGVAMTYDPVNGVVLAFGGVLPGLSYVNELWTYSVPANAWTRITPASSPPPRWKAAFTYDPVQRAAILYGGLDAAGIRSDLWRYYVTNRTWQELQPSGPHPRAMESVPMVYDTLDRRHILAGTDNLTRAFRTWAYDAATNLWTDLAPQGDLPPPTRGHSLVYDGNTRQTILFGGIQEFTAYGDVWEYNYTANSWRRTVRWSPNSGMPNPRFEHAMAYGPPVVPGGPDVGVSLLFGGIDNTSSYQIGTYYFSGITHAWMSPPVTSFPLSRRDHAFAWDPTSRRMVMFGGLRTDGIVTDETWVWGSGFTAAGTYESPVFDAGCESPIWHTLWWNATVPYMTSARFKLAASDSPTGPFDFVGWNGLPGAFYNGTPGQEVWSGHNRPPNQRYFRWFVRLTTGAGSLTPVLDDVSVDYACFPALPYITATTPAHLEINVRLTADIVAAFSVAMDPATVAWTFSDPAVSFTPSWDPAHKVLTLRHEVPYKKCAFQTIELSGKDAAHGLDLVPGPAPNPWTFSTDCSAPKVLRTTPADGAFNVPLDAGLLVEFTMPMNESTVSWTIDGGMTLTGTWDAQDTALTLAHAVPFAPCTVYTAKVSGKDRAGLVLIPGPVPNPWSFTTTCPNPYIAATDPADGEMWVPPYAPIVATFTRPMDRASVAWTISPWADLLASWSGNDTVLSLGHATPFAGVTRYTVNVTSAREKGGLPLVPGPVPNPWSFWTTEVAPLAAPSRLRVSMAGPDVRLEWDPVPGAAQYNVSGSEDRFAPWASWTRLGTTTAPSFLASGHGGDGRTHYYVVRAADAWRVSPNSTMGVKATLRFGYSWVGTSVAWFSLPYNSTYRRARDVASELGPANVSVVGKWIPSRQSSVVFYYTRDGWRGTDFPIAPGDGLYVGTVRPFEWNVTGTDANVTLSFTRNSPPRGNVNWISVPYTGVYGRASDIAGEVGPSRITEVGLWDEGNQSAVRYVWNGTAWAGTDFPVAPGAGVYVVVASSFSWTPALVTPARP